MPIRSFDKIKIVVFLLQSHVKAQKQQGWKDGDNDKSAYRKEVDCLVHWCSQNHQ
ncbi:hypothetical protein CRENBAI_010842 [Crenichthys baileyi]|uniref:Uncharacterized protein n=1 Tax=Crenichthys baileyi TaxID=28760 RepID=A0AAV9RDQ8_9TELE